MVDRTGNNLVRSNIVQGNSINFLREEAKSMFTNLKLKGSHSMDHSSLYAKASALCLKDSFLATGTFVSSSNLES